MASVNSANDNDNSNTTTPITSYSPSIASVNKSSTTVKTNGKESRTPLLPASLSSSRSSRKILMFTLRSHSFNIDFILIMCVILFLYQTAQFSVLMIPIVIVACGTLYMKATLPSLHRRLSKSSIEELRKTIQQRNLLILCLTSVCFMLSVVDCSDDCFVFLGVILATQPVLHISSSFGSAEEFDYIFVVVFNSIVLVLYIVLKINFNILNIVKSRTKQGSEALVVATSRIFAYDEVLTLIISSSNIVVIYRVLFCLVAMITITSQLNRYRKQFLELIMTTEENIGDISTEVETSRKILSTVSHEVRAPIASIIYNLEQVLSSKEFTKPVKETLHIIHESSLSLNELVESLLTYSKVKSTKGQNDYSSFSVAKLVDDVINTLEAAATAKHLLFLIDYRVDPWLVVKSDKGKLKQVLINIIGNAIKFTGEGKVTIFVDVTQVKEGEGRGPSQLEECEPSIWSIRDVPYLVSPQSQANVINQAISSTCTTDVMLSFCVDDTGIGIPKEKRSYIFRPFVQADSSISSKYGGAGLGLAICNELVEGMGGSMVVTSGGDGIGSRFCFNVKVSIEPQDQISHESLDSAIMTDDMMQFVPKLNYLRLPRHEHITVDSASNMLSVSIKKTTQSGVHPTIFILESCPTTRLTMARLARRIVSAVIEDYLKSRGMDVTVNTEVVEIGDAFQTLPLIERISLNSVFLAVLCYEDLMIANIGWRHLAAIVDKHHSRSRLFISSNQESREQCIFKASSIQATYICKPLRVLNFCKILLEQLQSILPNLYCYATNSQLNTLPKSKVVESISKNKVSSKLEEEEEKAITTNIDSSDIRERKNKLKSDLLVNTTDVGSEIYLYANPTQPSPHPSVGPSPTLDVATTGIDSSADDCLLDQFRELRCLVVDDNKTNRVILVRMLSKFKLKVIHEAVNGKEALQLMFGPDAVEKALVYTDLIQTPSSCSKSPFSSISVDSQVSAPDLTPFYKSTGEQSLYDVIFLDWHMPVVDGIRMAFITRMLESNLNHLPSYIIGLSADNSGFRIATKNLKNVDACRVNMPEKFLQTSFIDDYLEKPFAVSKLRSFLLSAYKNVGKCHLHPTFHDRASPSDSSNGHSSESSYRSGNSQKCISKKKNL